MLTLMLLMLLQGQEMKAPTRWIYSGQFVIGQFYSKCNVDRSWCEGNFISGDPSTRIWNVPSPRSESGWFNFDHWNHVILPCGVWEWGGEDVGYRYLGPDIDHLYDFQKDVLEFKYGVH